MEFVAAPLRDAAECKFGAWPPVQISERRSSGQLRTASSGLSCSNEFLRRPYRTPKVRRCMNRCLGAQIKSRPSLRLRFLAAPYMSQRNPGCGDFLISHGGQTLTGIAQQPELRCLLLLG